MRWSWFVHILLPIEPMPTPDQATVEAQARTLKAAQDAAREFNQLKRRARALGIEVDIIRSWGPREARE